MPHINLAKIESRTHGVRPCPFCGDNKPVDMDKYVRCQIFGCYSYTHSYTKKQWNNKLWRDGVLSALWLLEANDWVSKKLPPYMKADGSLLYEDFSDTESK